MMLHCPLEVKMGHFKLPPTVAGSKCEGAKSGRLQGSPHHITWNYSAQISQLTWAELFNHTSVPLQTASAAGEHSSGQTGHRSDQRFYQEQIYKSFSESLEFLLLSGKCRTFDLLNASRFCFERTHLKAQTCLMGCKKCHFSVRVL